MNNKQNEKKEDIQEIDDKIIDEVDSKTKRFVSTAIIVFSVILLILSAVYIADKDFRDVIDEKILKKTVTQEKLPTIELNQEKHHNIYMFEDYITILENGELKKYNSNAKLEKTINIDINNPMYISKNGYLSIAEKNNKKIYLIKNDEILWQKELEGNIVKIDMNKNGNIVVALSGTTYKTVILMLDNQGKEIFKTYLSQTIAIDVELSEDNKYMSFAEINTSGTLIQTAVKTLEIDKVKDKPADAIINTYTSNINQLIIDIKYTDKGKLICKYDDQIAILENGEISEIQKLKGEQKVNGASINLANNIVRVLQTSTGTFKADTTVEIYNIINKKESIYITEGYLKNLFTHQNIIALNFGTEVHFIDTNGWLMRKYTSKEEMIDVKIGNTVGAIIYKDRIEIVKL